MKSSTLHRSNLSKERIAVLEELLADKKPYDSSPGVYVRSDKDRELDLLWQGFKVNKDERSPGVYLSIGFFTGAICMFLMTMLFSFGNPNYESFIDLNLWKKANFGKSMSAVNVAPAVAEQAKTSQTTVSTTSTGKTENYVIKNGDTLEKVAKIYYGASTPARIQQIQKANGMDNPNKIKIGQSIKVPMNS